MSGNLPEWFQSTRRATEVSQRLSTQLSDLLHLQDSRTHSQHHNYEAYILTDAQHRFRKRSCETQLLLTIQDLPSTINVMGQTDVTLLDFPNAFDKVPHLRLLSKIKYYRKQNSLKRMDQQLPGRSQPTSTARWIIINFCPGRVRCAKGERPRPIVVLSVHKQPPKVHIARIRHWTFCWWLCVVPSY